MAENLELIVSDFEIAKQITFNYDELKANLITRLEKYKGVVYTEDTIKDAKADRALLNKLSKAINDEKKRVKEKLLEPYADFENKCKELMAIIEESSKEKDDQIKAFEQQAKDEKLQEVLQYWIENSAEYAEVVEIDKLVKPEWLNKSYSMTKVKQEIDHIISKMKMDLQTIKTSLKEDEKVKQATAVYFDNIGNPTNLSLALQQVNHIEEVAQKLEEKKEEMPQVATTAENEEVLQFDFRVWATKSQLLELREYLKKNNIKVGKVG